MRPKEPFEHTRKLIQKSLHNSRPCPTAFPSLVIPLQARCRLSPAMGLGNCLPIAPVRQILDAEGVPSGNIYMVAGKADTDPLFPDDLLSQPPGHDNLDA